MSNLPRAEHPKPQMERSTWCNLNGSWQFEIDHGNSGIDRKLFQDDVTLNGSITVPFCPESKLSGVQYVDFMSCVWYKRTVQITEEQKNSRIVLHIGACDYKTTVYVNGKEVGSHKGGYISFSFDISAYVKAGENILTICAQDNTRDRMIPGGKQCPNYYSGGCSYTRTTGIWQTVWLEFMPADAYIEKVKYYPNPNAGTLTVHAQLKGAAQLRLAAFWEGKKVGETSLCSQGGNEVVSLKLDELHLWEVGKGGLYDLELTYGKDTVKSYFGMRSLRLDGMKFRINEKSVFQRLVLDQGFYPDGIYTAPTDEELRKDVERSMAVGFNGARLHEKIFEERFLYHCDQLGYIVWGEFPNWGLDISYADSIYGILPEWIEELERDFNHPAIVGWCPFNETWDENGRKQYDDVLRMVYRTTKAIDPTRPCIDTSGNFHVETDIFDVHDYDQNPETFTARYNRLMTEGVLEDRFSNRQKYTGGPTFVSEYGGIRWSDDVNGWGYGNAPQTEEEFMTRLEGLTDALLNNDQMFGYCYTQLTDIEQEQNGVYYYDRTPKFDTAKLKAIFGKKAAIED